jgi:hypothetical protein
MSRRFSAQQIASFCPEGQRALKGKVISTEWNRCELGSWLYWWLVDTLDVLPAYELRDDILRATGYYFAVYSPSPARVERTIARYIRANFYSTGRRKNGR